MRGRCRLIRGIARSCGSCCPRICQRAWSPAPREWWARSPWRTRAARGRQSRRWQSGPSPRTRRRQRSTRICEGRTRLTRSCGGFKRENEAWDARESGCTRLAEVNRSPRARSQVDHRLSSLRNQRIERLSRVELGDRLVVDEDLGERHLRAARSPRAQEEGREARYRRADDESCHLAACSSRPTAPTTRARGQATASEVNWNYIARWTLRNTPARHAAPRLHHFTHLANTHIL